MELGCHGDTALEEVDRSSASPFLLGTAGLLKCEQKTEHARPTRWLTLGRGGAVAELKALGLDCDLRWARTLTRTREQS